MQPVGFFTSARLLQLPRLRASRKFGLYSSPFAHHGLTELTTMLILLLNFSHCGFSDMKGFSRRVHERTLSSQHPLLSPRNTTCAAAQGANKQSLKVLYQCFAFYLKCCKKRANQFVSIIYLTVHDEFLWDWKTSYCWSSQDSALDCIVRRWPRLIGNAISYKTFRLILLFNNSVSCRLFLFF